MPAKGLHNGLAAHVGSDIEESAQRFVHHAHAPVAVQPQDALAHAVEKRLLPGVELAVDVLPLRVQGVVMFLCGAGARPSVARGLPTQERARRERQTEP
jgi:hypothetical protein